MPNGIARIYDAVLAMIILMTALMMTLGYVGSFRVDEGWRDLGELSSNLLIYLDKEGMLAPLVFNQDYERAESIIAGILPPGLGFKLSVYTEEGKLIWSVDHQFKPGKSSSTLIFLSGYGGEPSPRVVALSLTR